jgi:serine/threonine-protein kinase
MAGAERERWREVQDLFHRALELEPARREAFLERQCAHDPALHAEVSGLLADALPEESRALGAHSPEDLSGQRFGDYELVRIVGQGSMGTIYEARQRWVERSVALKILRQREDVLSAGATAEGYERMARRFLSEAEVLGLLDHPGIVPIHTLERAGERTYFTMRLVRGDDFRDLIARVHARADGWGWHRALGVVLRVCETMAFAHARGVLHRDLKPSHVMVGAFGEVYVVDWGLARLPTRPDERDLRLQLERGDERGPTATRAPAPLSTVEGDVIGTPAYMPPEQARGELGRLDERADVYAVGALLHHLLVGHPPYLAEGERVTGRVVLERVLAGPPGRILALAPAVPPALAAIAEKAMRRVPEERYASMEALAEDLHAFLENRVVAAHRTGAWVEAVKWLQRNRLVAGAAGLVVLSAAAFGVGVLRLQREKARTLAAAVEETARERDRAREQAALARAATAFLEDLFRGLDPVAAQGEPVTLRAALERAAARLEGEARPAEPLVEAAVRLTLGGAYHQLGHLEEAEPLVARALELRRAHLAGADPERLRAEVQYGALLRDLARFGEAETVLAGALSELRRAQGPAARETRRAQVLLAEVRLDSERFDEAEALAAELLAALEGEPPGEELVAALEVLGTVHYRRDELERAEALFRRQLELDRALFGEDHSNTLVATSNLAAVLDALGRHGEALELGLASLARFRRVFGPTHVNTLSALANTGIQLFNLGRRDEGLAQLGEALELEAQALGADHPRVALARYNLAECLRRSLRCAEAVPLYEELVEWQRPRLDPDHADLRRSLHGLADCLMGTEEWGRAADVLGKLVELERRNPEGALSDAALTEKQLRLCEAKLGLGSDH